MRASVLSCLALSFVPGAAADPPFPGPGQPDDADLHYYLECARIAEKRLLDFEEAGSCSRVFLRIKLSFVPGVTLEEFDRLPLSEKTEVNSLGYLRYLEWKASRRDSLNDESADVSFLAAE